MLSKVIFWTGVIGLCYRTYASIEYYATAKQLDLPSTLRFDIKVAVIIILFLITVSIGMGTVLEKLEIKDKEIQENLKVVRRVEETKKLE